MVMMTMAKTATVTTNKMTTTMTDDYNN
jgi:hypothetical protein